MGLNGNTAPKIEAGLSRVDFELGLGDIHWFIHEGLVRGNERLAELLVSRGKEVALVGKSDSQTDTSLVMSMEDGGLISMSRISPEKESAALFFPPRKGDQNLKWTVPARTHIEGTVALEYRRRREDDFPSVMIFANGRNMVVAGIVSDEDFGFTTAYYLTPDIFDPNDSEKIPRNFVDGWRKMLVELIEINCSLL